MIYDLVCQSDNAVRCQECTQPATTTNPIVRICEDVFDGSAIQIRKVVFQIHRLCMTRCMYNAKDVGSERAA